MRSLINTLINNRYISYWLWLFVSIALPVIIIGRQFNFMDRTIAFQIGFPMTLVLFWALIRFWSEISDAVSTMPEGITRELAVSFMKIGPYVLLYFIGFFLNTFYQDYMFVAGTLLVTQVGGVILNANHNRLKRKDLIDRGYVNVLKQ